MGAQATCARLTEVFVFKLLFRAAVFSKMPETMEISDAAKSGNGTVEQVGIKMTGTHHAPIADRSSTRRKPSTSIGSFMARTATRRIEAEVDLFKRFACVFS